MYLIGRIRCTTCSHSGSLLTGKSSGENNRIPMAMKEVTFPVTSGRSTDASAYPTTDPANATSTNAGTTSGLTDRWKWNRNEATKSASTVPGNWMANQYVRWAPSTASRGTGSAAM